MHKSFNHKLNHFKFKYYKKTHYFYFNLLTLSKIYSSFSKKSAVLLSCNESTYLRLNRYSENHENVLKKQRLQQLEGGKCKLRVTKRF